MKPGISSLVVGAVVLGAAGASLLYPERTPAPRVETSSTLAAPMDTVSEPVLPPNHPTVGEPALPANHPPMGGSILPPDHPAIGGSPHGAEGSLGPATDEAPAISWKVPASWQVAPNPNAMRIATYRPSADTELSVARAGGSTDANIQRWIGQFDNAGPDKRAEKTVRGFTIQTVEISGTYDGGGTMAGSAAEPRRGWTLVGAVVETPGSHYFFKLLGPSEQVRAARASFDTLIASITPG